MSAPSPWNWRPGHPALLEQPATLLRLDGPDTLRFLHGQTSQALALARAGERLATCCISPTARLRALAQVLVDSDGAWLVVEAGDGEAVRTALDRVLFPADAVRLGPVEPVRLLEPVGPAADPATPASGPVDPPSAAAGHWQAFDDGSGWALDDGRLLLRPDAPLPAALTALPRLGPTAAERWRIQRGVPAPPGEINEEVNPFELGLAPRVRLDKGCYVGQETLARLATYDGVKQQLRRWFLADGEGQPASAPQPGLDLRHAAGERAGQLSSVLRLESSDGWSGWIGLALVRRAALEEATLLAGDSGSVLNLSTPEAFVAPPVGAGGQPGGQGRS
ncbi:MAG: folate-binding protein [Cyanobacteriota bacterium]|nr:folate-binding protein [Cyanobacteriota bacterium]